MICIISLIYLCSFKAKTILVYSIHGTFLDTSWQILVLIERAFETSYHSSRIRILRFFKNPQNATFYVFLKRHLKKARKKRKPKFEVSDFADFSLHGISTTAQKQCMFIIYMYSVSQKNPPLWTCGSISKTAWNVSTKFYVPITRSYLR